MYTANFPILTKHLEAYLAKIPNIPIPKKIIYLFL